MDALEVAKTTEIVILGITDGILMISLALVAPFFRKTKEYKYGKISL